MTVRARLILFLMAAPAFAGLLAWGFGGLPPFGSYAGPYGDIVNSITIPSRRITAAVSAVNFDLRAFDTVGEEFILFTAVIGVMLLLRASREDEERGEPQDEAQGRRVPDTSDAVRVWGLALVGVMILFGLYVATHAHITPGGGFQGGVVLATALLLVYLSGEFLTFERVSPQDVVEVFEAAGTGGFVAAGFVVMAGPGAYLENLLPLGQPGQFVSGGLIPIVNGLVTVAVTAGFVVMLSEFLEHTLLIRRSGGGSEDRRS
jgi:multicomponent Na+:H+ antiporter subunit B